MQREASTSNPSFRHSLHQMARLATLVRGYWSPLLKAMAIGLVLGLLGMVTPYGTKLLIDEVYPSGNVTLMHVLVLGILAITVAQACIGSVRSYYTTFTTAHLAHATSLLFFNHLQHLRSRFFEDHRVGEIMTRFDDVRSSLTGLARLFESLFINGIYLVLVPGFLLLLQWKLALVVLVTVPLSVATTALSGRVLRKYWKQGAEEAAALNAYQVEVLSQIRTFRVLAQEPEVFANASRQTTRALRMQLKAAGYGEIFGAVNALIRGLGMALFTWYGWTLILRQEMTLGDFIAFTAYVAYLYGPLAALAQLFSDYQRLGVSLGRMFEYLDLPVEQEPTTSYQAAPAIRHALAGEIRLHAVDFSYTPDKRVLRSLTLELSAGSSTAVVGASGAGKSSLLRLISRLDEPDAGWISIGGRRIREIPLSDLRRQVSVVWQEPGLVRGSIWDNLTLGSSSPTHAAVDEAVRICRLEPLLSQLPRGYHTAVGEWGATLSAGQRQRLALARALIRDTPILLLDEATANIDLQGEAEILGDLFARHPGRTLVFVTHRVATAALADQVVMLENGEAVAVGTHAALLDSSERYRRLLCMQPAPAQSPTLPLDDVALLRRGALR